ncbi:hypothetical protein GCM10027052_19060 [Parafrigoribacterium mesophilum]|uniref:hypothetical protein n=1 Tax=Parafrigoribacterium mesophilum TaxID=433646 RepID=UPI0031FD4BD3
MTIDDNNGSGSPVRVGTIIWGFILVAIAAFFFAGTQFDLAGFNPAVVATWSVLGLGALAVIGGVAGALFRR